jgi:hypothetical protein
LIRLHEKCHIYKLFKNALWERKLKEYLKSNREEFDVDLCLAETGLKSKEGLLKLESTLKPNASVLKS